MRAFGRRLQRPTKTALLLVGGAGVIALGVAGPAWGSLGTPWETALIFPGGLLLFEGLIRIPLVSGIGVFENNTERAKEKWRSMISKANYNILMSCGGLGPNLYTIVGSALEEEVH